MNRNHPQELGHEELNRLDRHASLLAGHRLESANRLRDESAGEIAQLMQLAERVGRSLQPVAPEPSFRRSLRASLRQESEAVLKPQALARVSGARRRLAGVRLSSKRSRGIIGGGAAVAAVVGVAAYYWLGRNETEQVAAS